MPRARMKRIALYHGSHGQGFSAVASYGYVGTTRMGETEVWPLGGAYRFGRYGSGGQGQADVPTDAVPCSIDVADDGLCQFLTCVEVRRAVVGGLYIGGDTSQCFNARHPDMVSVVGLRDTGPGYRNMESKEAWNREPQAVAENLWRGGMKAHADSPATITCVPRELTMNYLGLANFARKVVAMSDSLVLLAGIRVLTLVLVKENNSVVPQVEEKVVPR